MGNSCAAPFSALRSFSALASPKPPAKAFGSFDDEGELSTTTASSHEELIPAATYPVLSIAPEIISRIFLECSSASHVPSPKRAPLLTAQICSYWRSVALSTPELWTKMHASGSVDLLHLWASRSRSLPLAFTLETRDVARGRALLEAAMLYHSRWQSIDVRTPAASHDVLLSLSNADFPFLRQISLHIPLKCYFGIVQAPDLTSVQKLSFRNVPQLREVHLNYFPSTHLEIPWNRIRTLRAEPSVDLEQDLAFLRRCTNLAELAFRWGGPVRHLEGWEKRAICLPFLQSLELCDPSLVEFLTLPRLRRLHISVRRTWSQPDTLRSLVSAWGCTVEYLGLVFTTPVHLPEFLTAFTDVRELKLSLVDLCADDLLRTAVLSLSGNIAFPNLQRLYIAVDTTSYCHNELLVHMLRLRVSDFPGRAKLESFEYYVPMVWDELDDAPFRSLVRDTGLRVKIFGSGTRILFRD